MEKNYQDENLNQASVPSHKMSQPLSNEQIVQSS